MNTAYIVVSVIDVIGIIMLFGRGSSSQSSLPENVTDDCIRVLVHQGKKIKAINWYRTLY